MNTPLENAANHDGDNEIKITRVINVVLPTVLTVNYPAETVVAAPATLLKIDTAIKHFWVPGSFVAVVLRQIFSPVIINDIIVYNIYFLIVICVRNIFFF